MRSNIASALVSCFIWTLWSGCLSTQQITGRPLGATLDVFNGVAVGKSCRILLRNEELYFGHNAVMTGDSTRFRRKGFIQAFSNKDIDRITIIDNGKGAGKGLKSGALVGASAGALFGFTVGRGLCETNCSSEVPRVTVVAGAAGAIVFGLVGAGPGALQGYHNTYVLITNNP